MPVHSETPHSCCSRWMSCIRSALKWKIAGQSMAATAMESSPAFASAACRLKVCSLRRQPPTTMAPPATSSRLPRIDPVTDAFTTAFRPFVSAMTAMISSAAFPKVAFSRPPHVGPEADGEVFRRRSHQQGQRNHPDRRQGEGRDRLPWRAMRQPMADEREHDGRVPEEVRDPHRQATCPSDGGGSTRAATVGRARRASAAAWGTPSRACRRRARCCPRRSARRCGRARRSAARASARPASSNSTSCASRGAVDATRADPDQAHRTPRPMPIPEPERDGGDGGAVVGGGGQRCLARQHAVLARRRGAPRA